MNDSLKVQLIMARILLATSFCKFSNGSTSILKDELEQCDKELSEIYNDNDEFYRYITQEIKEEPPFSNLEVSDFNSITNVLERVLQSAKDSQPPVLEICWKPKVNDNEVLEQLSQYYFEDPEQRCIILPLIQKVACSMKNQQLYCHDYTDEGHPVGQFCFNEMGPNIAYDLFRNQVISNCPETGKSWTLP